MPSIISPVAMPKLAATAPISPLVLPPEPRPAPVTALQSRTTEQLKDGLRVQVLGGAPPEKAGEVDPPAVKEDWSSLAAARLVQDAADYVATTSGVKPSIAKLYLGDAKPEHRTWAGYAWFDGEKGSFALTKTTADDLIKGIKQLKTTPFEQWSAHDQSKFASTQETVLHELGHITLPDYGAKTMTSWDHDWSRNHTIEEGLTEIAAQHDLPGFFANEFGTPLPARVADQSANTSVYRRWTTGLDRMFHAAGVDEADYGRAAKVLGDATYPGSRSGVIARSIVAQHGGDPEGSNGRLTRVIANALPEFVNEFGGAGGKIAASTDMLDDIHSGRKVDATAYEAEITELQKVIASSKAQRHDDF